MDILPAGSRPSLGKKQVQILNENLVEKKNKLIEPSEIDQNCNDIKSASSLFSVQNPQRRMHGSTTLYDRDQIVQNQRNKVQKSIILFSNESGITLGDLEQLKISNMKDIKKEDEIIKEELGENADVSKLKDILKNEQASLRLSTKLADPTIFQMGVEQEEKQIEMQNDTFQVFSQQMINTYDQPLGQDEAAANDITNTSKNKSGFKKSSSANENDFDEEDEVVENNQEPTAQQVPIIPIEYEQRTRRTSMKQSLSKIKPPLVTIKGYLYKRSPKYFVGWQKRWCVLEDQKFFYFKNETTMRSFGCIQFNIISTRAEVIIKGITNTNIFYCAIQKLVIGKKSKKKKMLLKFNMSDKKFLFKSSDSNQPIEMWLAQVNNHIQQSIGYTQELSLVSKKFWKDDRISQKEFLESADTGDLILFKGKSFQAKLQRALTGSEFDHVAIVLKYSTTDIFLMEALGGQIGKVILFRWNLFQKNKWYEFYDKIVYRKLNMKRTNESLSNLEEFITFALNKKYKFTIGKMLRKKTSQKEESDSNENRTFFCSELVASVYKKLGILNDKIPSSAYLPGHFSLEKNLSFEGGANLSSEQLVDFLMV